ncbi:MAG: ribosome maturation factor RimP [Acidobacteria bacterium]|nr:ribosome maturation factor RimP [Acidobacteriota bacterium]
MDVPEQLEREIQKVVESEGLELVHIGIAGSGGHRALRIDIDKEGGVTLGDCELVSKQLGPLLDVIDAFPGAYDLEVSSPGIDRKFYRNEDYQRFLGSLVRVRTSAPVGGLHVIVGRLKSFENGRIVVVDEKSKKLKEYEIELDQIKETRLEPDFRERN